MKLFGKLSVYFQSLNFSKKYLCYVFTNIKMSNAIDLFTSSSSLTDHVPEICLKHQNNRLYLLTILKTILQVYNIFECLRLCNFEPKCKSATFVRKFTEKFGICILHSSSRTDETSIGFVTHQFATYLEFSCSETKPGDSQLDFDSKLYIFSTF